MRLIIKITEAAIASLLISVVLGSCASEVAESINVEQIKMSFNATSQEPGVASSRTALADDEGSVVWSGGDHITVFDGAGKNCPFTLYLGAGTSRGQFGGTVTSDVKNWYGLYPYSAGATISGNTISGVQIPASQTAVENGFDPATGLMTAHTTNTDLNFKQACCYVTVTTTEPCNRIVFKSNGTENIAGTASLTVGDDGIVTSSSITSNGSTSITLNPTDGETTIPAGKYLIALLPQTTLASGFTMECYGTDSQVLYREYTRASTTFTRGKIVNMGTASMATGWAKKAYHNYVDLGLPSGTLWAETNIGGVTPENFGDYFAWGATTTWYEAGYGAENPQQHWKSDKRPGTAKSSKGGYSWGNAPFCVKTDETFVSLSGSVTAEQMRANWDEWYQAGFKNLLNAHDAAYQIWGSDWCMPRYEDFKELCENCFCKWVDSYKGSVVCGLIVFKAKSEQDKGYWTNGTNWRQNNKSGVYIDCSKPDIEEYDPAKDIHIFFPAAGYRVETSLNHTFEHGNYWTKTHYNINYPNDSFYMHFRKLGDSGSGYSGSLCPTSNNHRRYGCTIRPIRNRP